jgi:hypothetical protein
MAISPHIRNFKRRDLLLPQSDYQDIFHLIIFLNSADFIDILTNKIPDFGG